MNSDQNQTLDLIRSDYPKARVTNTFDFEGIEIEDEATGEQWILDCLGIITMHNGEWL